MTKQMTRDEIEAMGAGFRPSSFEQLWTAIGRLPFVSQDGPYAWRGVPRDSYRIASSLYRRVADENPGVEVTEKLLRDKELGILGRARDWGLGGIGSQKVTDLQLLAQLQHHGVPTRLLDVTANPLTALWFACQEPTVDGLLMAFDIGEYEAVLTEDTPQTCGKLEDPTGWDLKYALEKSAKHELPFLVRPSFLDARMSAQEGFFLASACPSGEEEWEQREIPRAEADGLFLIRSRRIDRTTAEQMLFGSSPEHSPNSQALWCFVIPSEMKPTVLTALASNFNRRADTLFPDYAGFLDYAIGRPPAACHRCATSAIERPRPAS